MPSHWRLDFNIRLGGGGVANIQSVALTYEKMFRLATKDTYLKPNGLGRPHIKGQSIPGKKNTHTFI